MKFFSSLRGLPTRFKRYLSAVGLFGIGAFAYSLLILAATAPLTPSLGAADRFGHLPMLAAGYVLGTRTAVLTALAFWFAVDSIALLSGIFFVVGLYVADQDALELTVTAEMAQPGILAMSYGALGTFKGIAKFISRATVRLGVDGGFTHPGFLP